MWLQVAAKRRTIGYRISIFRNAPLASAASSRAGLPLPASELGFTRVRHFRLAEVGYIQLRLGIGKNALPARGFIAEACR